MRDRVLRLLPVLAIPLVLTGALGEAATAEPVGFRFRPDASVQSMFVAGDFNHWNPSGLPMADEDGDGQWEATADLPPGRYEYLFVVDGEWLEDSDAAESVRNAFGGRSSVVVVGESDAQGAFVNATSAGSAPDGDAINTSFRYQPLISGVEHVMLAGSFNDWNASATEMADDDGDGVYTATLPLPPGEHRYKFVVDGNWITDTAAESFTDDGLGGTNSVVHVGEAAARPAGMGPRRVLFSCEPPSAPGEMYLAGTFNDWAVGKTPMSDDDGDGLWTTTLLLPPGRHQYKFVVDGNWITDESADAFSDDGFGGQNSIIEVDARHEEVTLRRGDGLILTEGIVHRQTLREVNRASEETAVITARAFAGDVEGIDLVAFPAGVETRTPMANAGRDATHEFFRGDLVIPEGADAFEYHFVYRDGDAHVALTPGGFAPEAERGPGFTFSADTITLFDTPDWIRDGVIYQIFPERFANGDPSNDPDFQEPWYDGKTTLPRSGSTNEVYYHATEDWYDTAGLAKSPYRTDGRPDYFSFYGGDIEGVRQNLDYLEDLGISVIYFNPLFPAESNHKYDACDYRGVDPHFGDEATFRAFVDEAHARGIRIVADWVINHTGDCHYAFRDTMEKGPESAYWDWYEWKRWPLPDRIPEGERMDAYYACWWGFGSLPELNFDLSRPNAAENNIGDIADAEVNQPVIDNVLESARYWLTDLDVDGFRLDVPNEVPFWIWKLFRAEVKRIKPDAYLVGEIWGDAGDWVSPECFDATMNYRYFKDPAVGFLGKGEIDAKRFDADLASGRMAYPEQAVRVMMNLVDSHDTPRHLTAIGGDIRRLLLTALFQMTYVGSPHIYYGDEIAMTGGADPDCRRPFRWTWRDEPERVAVHDRYRELIRLRRTHAAFTSGEYKTLFAEGGVHAFARFDESELFIIAMNASDRAASASVPLHGLPCEPDAAFRSALEGGADAVASDGTLALPLDAVSAVILRTPASP
ncbi:MAG: alpha-amylase family glycosyl hydrolase [Gemmatimonadota bacterium]|nr:alpha-amylase family glycosyl hydrolase [Gemmatimonadota bacterium]MDP6801578.1 alpha-amylase family glycosyl hydrolase [Gemmatimonadota bacterium]